MYVIAVIEAGKHVFQEKFVTIDPTGARLMAETTQKAKENNLSMVSGMIRRYQKDYIETRKRVQNGDMGDAIDANIIRDGGLQSLLIGMTEPNNSCKKQVLNYPHLSTLFKLI